MLLAFFAGDGIRRKSKYAGNGIKRCSTLDSLASRRWYSGRYDLSVRFAFSFFCIFFGHPLSALSFILLLRRYGNVQGLLAPSTLGRGGTPLHPRNAKRSSLACRAVSITGISYAKYPFIRVSASASTSLWVPMFIRKWLCGPV